MWFMALQASPTAALEPRSVMLLRFLPLWVESFQEDTHPLVFPLYLQQQVQGHMAGVQKTCAVCESMNISSDSRLSTIKETS